MEVREGALIFSRGRRALLLLFLTWGQKETEAAAEESEGKCFFLPPLFSLIFPSSPPPILVFIFSLFFLQLLNCYRKMGEAAAGEHFPPPFLHNYNCSKPRRKKGKKRKKKGLGNTRSLPISPLLSPIL